MTSSPLPPWRNRGIVVVLIRMPTKRCVPMQIMHKNNKTGLRPAPSIDNAPLPLLNGPDYISSKPQLNHLFIDNEYFSEPWHGDQYMNVVIYLFYSIHIEIAS